MIPEHRQPLRKVIGIPRESGDDPLDNISYARPEQYSPRERG